MPASASSLGGAYTVKLGDTLSRIAHQQGLGSWRVLYDANPSVKNPNLIFPGQRLDIPGAGAQVSHRSSWSGTSSVRHHRRHATVQSSSSTTSHHRSASSSRSSGSVAGGGVWDRIAQCESGGNWSTNTGNGFYGGLQFTMSSWHAAGGSGSPQNASRSEQIRVAQNLQRMQGWGAWPVCSRAAGAR